jgi:hypothetical protein
LTKGNGAGSLEEMSDKAFEIAKRRQTAAADVMKLFEEHYATTLESHTGTVLHAAAWLAGTSLYRSLGYQEEMEPGVVVLSEEANQQIPAVMKVFLFLLDKEGVKLGTDGFIAKIPEELRPRKTLLQIQEQFQDRYNAIMKGQGFDYREGAKTGAVVCALLVKLYSLRRKELDANLAASIVSLAIVEGAKTAPAALKGK